MKIRYFGGRSTVAGNKGIKISGYTVRLAERGTDLGRSLYDRRVYVYFLTVVCTCATSVESTREVEGRGGSRDAYFS